MSAEAIEKIKAKFGSAVLAVHSDHGDDTALINRHDWADVCAHARDELGFDMFIDLTAADYLGHEEGLDRFEVVLHLRNMKTGARIRLKARVPEATPAIASLCELWKGANWFERECHEMYGIKFMGHPDLRPLLLYPEFKGYPLRKDYPINKRQPRIKLLAPETDRRRSPDETPLCAGACKPEGGEE